MASCNQPVLLAAAAVLAPFETSCVKQFQPQGHVFVSEPWERFQEGFGAALAPGATWQVAPCQLDDPFEPSSLMGRQVNIHEKFLQGPVV